MIFRRCHPIVLAGITSTPADDLTTRGNAALEAQRYLEAWHAYKSAFQLDPTPLRASRVASAAPYAVRMSAAIDDLWQWLVLKRDDARRSGDREESWNELEAVVRSYEANVRRSEQAQMTQRTEIDRLEQQILGLQEMVQRPEAEPRRFRKPAIRHPKR